MKVYGKRNDVARNTDPESNIEITPNHTTASLSLVKTVHCSLPSLKMYLKYLRLSLRDDSKLRRSRELKHYLGIDVDFIAESAPILLSFPCYLLIHSFDSPDMWRCTRSYLSTTVEIFWAPRQVFERLHITSAVAFYIPHDAGLRRNAISDGTTTATHEKKKEKPNLRCRMEMVPRIMHARRQEQSHFRVSWKKKVMLGKKEHSSRVVNA
ncbi:hypothetical protein CDAR_526271 [Caerostris darwini]|uniref:Uncharacterized protein n=1 Tax=Caerostris darwini TaxID=1538125 RepID=A0AAV4QYB7_9ARAC|nr:hypothetical protein CDAR_526271 [Caerostris darwini]